MGSNNAHFFHAGQRNGYWKWPWTDRNLSRVRHRKMIDIENIITKRVVTYAVCEWAALAS